MNVVVFSILMLQIFIINAEETQYGDKFDGIDFDEILRNDRLLSAYVKCLLESGACTPDGNELKKNLPDAIENDCEKCSKKQREDADKVMHYIIDNRPEDWIKLEEKYHSDGSYKNKYLASKQLSEDQEDNNNTTILAN